MTQPLPAIFLQSPDVTLSVTVLGELYYGAQKSNRIDENLARIDQFLEGVTVIDNDIATAYEYGAIRNELRLKGRPISRKTTCGLRHWARQHDLTLVSRDRHFAEVENLRWEQW